MKELTFKIKNIYSIKNSGKDCRVTIDAILLPPIDVNLDLRGKVLRRESIEAIVISTRYEDKVNYGLLLTMRDISSVHLYETITFTVHENH